MRVLLLNKSRRIINKRQLLIPIQIPFHEQTLQKKHVGNLIADSRILLTCFTWEEARATALISNEQNIPRPVNVASSKRFC